MNRDRVIFKNPGQTKKSIIKSSLIFAFAVGPIFYLATGQIIWTIAAIGLALVFSLIFSGPDGQINLFDGWEIKENSITLHRENIFSSKSVELAFVDIEKIEYLEKRRGRYIRIKTKDKKYQLSIIFDIFKFADTLKYLKQKNILIIFNQRDAEIELYLSDKIDKIPMNNE